MPAALPPDHLPVCNQPRSTDQVSTDQVSTDQTGTVQFGRPRIRAAAEADWPAIWAMMEPIVRAGETYCWDRGLGGDAARRLWFEPEPACVYVAEIEGNIRGTAQLHPNRGGGGSHVANASFMTDPAASGQGIARALAGHVLSEAAAQGYHAMQFNAVVETNTRAVALWQSLGFRILATVPGAFRHPSAGLTGLHIMYKDLTEETAVTPPDAVNGRIDP